MPMRIDALTTSSEIILSIESIGQTYHDQGIVTTVGYMADECNSRKKSLYY
ncbi:hypothetical protein J4710_03945 [Staphylococcus xylosus]|uniref:Uncharacterized protein n=1 Tax=Staphylococcus xylosus TaxID=1288 RepID=A0A939SJY6_STAXY|nr:hypothetical protein [Staphylococcus xylosus]